MNEKNRQTAACVLKARSQKTLKDHIHQIEFKMILQTINLVKYRNCGSKFVELSKHRIKNE